MSSGIIGLFSCPWTDASAWPASSCTGGGLGVVGILGVLSSALDVRLFTGDNTLR